MRRSINICDWCKEHGDYMKLHVLTAKDACAGSSDRTAFTREFCEPCGTALRNGDADVLSERSPKNA